MWIKRPGNVLARHTRAALGSLFDREVIRQSGFISPIIRHFSEGDRGGGVLGGVGVGEGVWTAERR